VAFGVISNICREWSAECDSVTVAVSVSVHIAVDALYDCLVGANNALAGTIERQCSWL